MHLKKRRAKARLGSDATWLQKQTVEAVAGRSPQEVRAMVRRWMVSLVIAASVLALVGVFLYTWTVAAGVAVHVVAVVLLVVAYRLRKQGPGLAEMAESLR